MSSDSVHPQIDALYQEHHSWLRGWLRKKLGNSFDAADLAHDTFLRVLHAGRSVTGEQPRALLTHIAKGLVIDFWRRQDVERAYADAIALLPQDHVPSEEARLLVVDALMQVDAMLRAMPGATREVFLLAQVEELPYAAIAERVGISLATVNRHMRRAYIACIMCDCMA